MKGIIINEGSPLLENKYVNACYIKHGDLSIQLSPGDETLYSLSGAKDKSANACCSKKDTYDFETGALISLMRLCGLEKSAKAYAEMFDDTAYGDALIERDKLKEKVDDLYAYNKNLIEEIDQKNHEIIALKSLRLSNESLKKDNESFRKTCEKLKESICAKEVLNGKLFKDYTTSQTAYEVMVEKSVNLVDKIKELEEENKRLSNEIENLRSEKEYLEKEIKSTKYENGLWKNSDNALRHEVKIVRDALNTWKQKYRDLKAKNGELIEENEKFKLDCEKLQHGYIDTDNAKPYPGYWDGDILDIVFISGRSCGKQYTALVNLFKKLPQDKIEAAYKEVYNTELPAWKKEFLNQMYGIYRESRKKEELPGTLDINGATYRKCDEKGRVVWMTDEFVFKPASKREKMWDYILKEGRTPVYVKRKDIHDFLEECQIAGIKWQSGKMPLETIPFDLIEPTDAGIYFFVMTSRIPNGFRHVMTWWFTAYNEDEQKSINYLPPMRWDLFKKGRIIVGVRRDQYNDFRDELTHQFGLTNQHKPYEDFNYTFYMYDKKANFVEALGRSQFKEIKKINGHKVVYWEDVK